MADNSGRPSSNSQPANNAADRIVREILDNRLSVTDISPSGELIRAIDRFNHNRAATTTTANTSQPPAVNQASHGTPSAEDIANARERRQQIRALLNEMPMPDVAGFRAILREHTSFNIRRSRPRMAEGSRYLERHRNLAENRHASTSSITNNALAGLADLHHAGQQLENASQHMRALLDDSQNILSQSSISAEEYAGEAEANRANKRRKIDTGMPGSGFPGFSYGHYGQVEPGKLKMEIESCDGGTFLDWYGDGSADSTAYSAGNVLKSDNSVYCTKGNRCNLVLRHQGATPFCLTELIIKGPPRNYTDPVQEGMVFISMASDDLLARTAQYQIQYSPPRSSRRRVNRDLIDENVVSIRHNDDGTTSGLDGNRRQHLYSVDSEDYDYRTAQIPSDFTQNAPPFHVTTECGDSDSDSSPPRRRRRRTTDRFGAILVDGADASSDSDSSGRDRPWHEDYLLGVPREGPPPSSSRRLERRSTASGMSIGLAEAVSAAQEATDEAIKAVGGVPMTGGARPGAMGSGLMAPHAWFFIQQDKSKCSIKFHPPVSGRFILLKMWSPHHTPAGNIDIQSVVAKGFAGPRYFPATQLR